MNIHPVRMSGIGLHGIFFTIIKNMPRPGQAWGWLPPFALLLSVIVAVPLRMLDEQGLPRYRALRTELNHVRRSNRQMVQEVLALQKKIEKLRRDPLAVEDIARDELGMLREGEILFQFPR
jgi:cell division protein FtsB